MISAWTERSSSTSIGTGPSSRSAGVSRGWTSRVAIPVRGVSEADERQTQAHRLRAPRGARERPGRAVRRRRRSHRRLRAVLVVHGRDGHVPRRRGDGPCDRRGGKSASPSSASRRFTRRSYTTTSSRRCGVHTHTRSPRSTSTRSCEGAAFDGRRRARKPRSGRVRLRAGDGGRNRARRARGGDRRGDEQRGRVPRAGGGTAQGGGAAGGRGGGRVRLGAGRQADARRVQGEERGTSGAFARGRASRPAGGESDLPGGASGAQRARRSARERGPRRRGVAATLL